MKPTTIENHNEESVDYLKLLTLICHLMTQYAMYPCQPLAVNINRHFQYLLNSSAAESLGEWKSTYEQLFTQWRAIVGNHIQQHMEVVGTESRQSVKH